nr:unnamed protein product [Callosobruchus analis]
MEPELRYKKHDTRDFQVNALNVGVPNDPKPNTQAHGSRIDSTGVKEPMPPISSSERSVERLLDSGATRTVLGGPGWSEIKPLFSLTKTSDKYCTVANGQSCEVLGEIPLPIQLQHEIDADALKHLTEEMLKEVIVKVGPRARFLTKLKVYQSIDTADLIISSDTRVLDDVGSTNLAIARNIKLFKRIFMCQ